MGAIYKNDFYYIKIYVRINRAQRDFDIKCNIIIALKWFNVFE